MFRDIVAVQQFARDLTKCEHLSHANIKDQLGPVFERDFINAKHRCAILIGVSDYGKTRKFDDPENLLIPAGSSIMSDLNTSSDLKIAKKALLDLGFSNSEVYTYHDLTKDQILKALRHIPKHYSLFLFFSGHGFAFSPNSTFFIPADFQTSATAILTMRSGSYVRSTFNFSHRDLLLTGKSNRSLFERPEINKAAFRNYIDGKMLKKLLPSKTCLVADICHAEGFVKQAKPSIGIFSSHQAELALEDVVGRDLVSSMNRLREEVSASQFEKFEKGGVFTEAFFKLVKDKGIKESLKIANDTLSFSQHAGIFTNKKYMKKSARKALFDIERTKRARLQFVKGVVDHIRDVGQKLNGYHGNEIIDMLKKERDGIKATKITFQDDSIVSDHLYDDDLRKRRIDIVARMTSQENSLQVLIEAIEKGNKHLINEAFHTYKSDSVAVMKANVRFFRRIMKYNKEVEKLFSKVKNLALAA